MVEPAPYSKSAETADKDWTLHLTLHFFDLSMLLNALPPTITTPIIATTMAACILANPGNWDDKQAMFYPWWTKIKLWVGAQTCSGSTHSNVGQTVCSHMISDAE